MREFFFELGILVVIFAVCGLFSDYILWGVAKLLHWLDGEDRD